MKTTYKTMNLEHLGSCATDADLAEFVALCEDVQRVHDYMDDFTVTCAVFGGGDYPANAKRLLEMTEQQIDELSARIQEMDEPCHDDIEHAVLAVVFAETGTDQ